MQETPMFMVYSSYNKSCCDTTIRTIPSVNPNHVTDALQILKQTRRLIYFTE